MATSFKAPPLLTDEIVYENWKREIEIWQAFTDLAQETRSSHFSDFTRESPRGSFGNQRPNR